MSKNAMKLVTLILSVVVFLCAFTCFASAEETAEEISLSHAEITEKDDGSFLLTVDLKNNSDTPLNEVAFFILNYDTEKITFNSSCFYGEALCAVIPSIPANSQGTANFPIDSCSDKNAKLNCQVQYLYGGSEANGGYLSNPSNFSIVDFSDILAQTEGPSMMDTIIRFLQQTGFSRIADNWKVLVMFAISFVLIYLAIVKKFEPLLLLPIAFGMLLTNLPGAEMFHEELFADGHVHWDLFGSGMAGLVDYLYLGVKLGIYPCLIFLGIGAMTDFAPLIANPKSLLLGAAAQLGIFITYLGANLCGFTPAEASAIGIIGGADGPTAIYVTSLLAPALLGPIAVAAYSYMALVPFIQPPIMRLLTTKKERMIEMKELRTVSRKEKIFFPILVTVFVALLVPSAAPLVGCLMLGNLMRESGVVERITKTAQNELMNIVTIFLGISVGATATADTFLSVSTLLIMAMGILAFCVGSAGGVLLAKFMNLFLKNKINPLIGSAGVSAVPMAARVSQSEGQKANPSNFLLMHAMGPNVAGVIGSAIAAGVLIALFA